MGSYLRNLIYW